MRDRGSKKKRLRDTLEISADDFPSCSITFASDCLDQTVLNIEFPIDIQKEWAEDLSNDATIAWVGENMFIIDRPRFYRLIGCIGNRDLNIRFRISNLDPLAWKTVQSIISNILTRNGIMAVNHA